MMYCSFDIINKDVICVNIEERCTVENYYRVQIKVQYNDLILSLRTSPLGAQPHNIFLCASCHPRDRSPTVTPAAQRAIRFCALRSERVSHTKDGPHRATNIYQHLIYEN
jgi:hypothetical protein